jgi:hypothetical protein
VSLSEKTLSFLYVLACPMIVLRARKPAARIEAAYHKAGDAIQKLVDLVAA